jgi:Tfp pilus assembly protein PilZ
VYKRQDPHSSIIQLRGRVAWLNTRHCRQKEALSAGFGVEFLASPEQTVRDLAGFIDQEPPSFT